MGHPPSRGMLLLSEAIRSTRAAVALPRWSAGAVDMPCAIAEATMGFKLNLALLSSWTASRKITFRQAPESSK